MPRLYSYVLREDTGFAPNPYHGFCTLACCKPRIRERAEIGDWIIGTGSSAKGKERGGHISYAMRVTDKLTFDQFWSDDRFLSKRPNLDGTLQEACGDNIYQFDYVSGHWCQKVRAFHCHSSEIAHDTHVEWVLTSDDFIYWGDDGPPLREFGGHSLIKKGPSHKCNFPEFVVAEFVDWIRKRQSCGETGVCGKPLDLKQAEKLRNEAKKQTA